MLKYTIPINVIQEYVSVWRDSITIFKPSKAESLHIMGRFFTQLFLEDDQADAVPKNQVPDVLKL